MVGASRDPHPHRRGSNGTGSKPNGAPSCKGYSFPKEERNGRVATLCNQTDGVS